MNSKLGKVLIGVLVLLIAISGLSPMASAKSIEKEKTIKEYSENEASELIDFIQNEAIEVDKNGYAKVDLQKVKDKFGYIPQEYIDFNNDNKNINENLTEDEGITTHAIPGTRKYDICITDEIKSQFKDIVGVSSFTAAIEALAEGSKGATAKHLVKAGAKGGIHGIVLSLGWIQVKCLGA